MFPIFSIMSVKNRIIEHRIATLGRSLSSVHASVRRKQIISEIVRFCVIAIESASTDEDRKYVRKVINEALKSQDDEGELIISNRIRLQIVMNVDLRMGEIDSPRDYLSRHKKGAGDESETSGDKKDRSWTPNFMKSLTGPLDLDK